MARELENAPASRQRRQEADRVLVAESSITTLFVLIVDALRPDPGRGLSPDLRDAIQATLPRTVRSVLAPLGAPYERWPDCLVPPPAATARGLDDALEEITDTSADTLLADLATEGIEDTAEWRPVHRDPRRWLLVYAETLRRAWEAVEPRWKDAAWQLEHEHERVQLAAGQGGVPALLTDLSPALDPGPPGPDAARIADDGLVVIPLMAGPEACARYQDADGRITHVAYAMPGARRTGPMTTPDARLVSLLGHRRASILRALDRPTTPGRLARVLDAGPSIATYHLNALEDAGLVVRHRAGGRILVHRTRRGTSLLALFAP